MKINNKIIIFRNSRQPLDFCSFAFSVEPCIVKEKKNAGKVVDFENQVTQIGDSAMMMTMTIDTNTATNHNNGLQSYERKNEQRFGLHGGTNDDEQHYSRRNSDYFDQDDTNKLYLDTSSSSDTFASQESEWRDTGRETSLFDCLSASTTMDNATMLSTAEEDDELYKMRLKTHQYQSELHYSDRSLSPYQHRRQSQNDEKSALPSLGERVGESYEQFHPDTPIDKGTLPSILEIVENIFSPAKEVHDVEYSITSSDSDSPSNHSTSHNNSTSLWVSHHFFFVMLQYLYRLNK